MTRWTCPKCSREFGKPGSRHTCLPALSVDDTFDGCPAVQRSAYDAVVTHLAEVGPVHEDAVTVGVFLKNRSKFAELRPKSRWLSLDLVLPRMIENRRVSRTIRVSERRVVHVIRLAGPQDVDDQIRAWLTEAYVAAE